MGRPKGSKNAVFFHTKRMDYPEWDIGTKHFSLTVVGPVFWIRDERCHHARIVCKCDCGQYTVVPVRSKVKSCGCSKIKHRESKTRLHRIWRDMRSRCSPTGYWEGRVAYHDRGIRVCDEWQSFIAFRDWALANGYVEPLTLDRIDPDGHYEPGNCRWITLVENSKWVVGAWKEKAANAEAERDLLAASVMFLLQELAA